jgi:hypothetical protein
MAVRTVRIDRWIVALVLAAGCGGGAGQPDGATGGDDSAADAGAPDAFVHTTVPELAGSDQICKLLNNLNINDPTPNNVQFRANVLGADLGIPVDHDGKLYLFFGDTIGFKGIWGGGQSHPDAVGYSLDPTSAVIANPALLCDRLRIVTLARASSVGPSVDAAIEADFAAGAMAAPGGHTLGEYIRNPSGPANQTFPNLPGDFEVPSGAFSYGGSMYIFYTTVVGPNDITMKGSYLAKWASPSPTTIPGYNILYGVDERFDAAGALRGDFINIAAEVHGSYVYLFGTGPYRASGVHLARKALATLDTPGGFEQFDPASGQWVAQGAPTAPIFGPAGFGETSVRYFPQIGRWMFLAEELLPTSNRIIARFADQPEGPWSDAIVVHDMGDSAFRNAYCCAVENQCTGKQFFNCNRTGFYGTYLLPGLQLHDDGSFTVLYTMSSFDPYNVAVFKTTFTD